MPRGGDERNPAIELSELCFGGKIRLTGSIDGGREISNGGGWTGGRGAVGDGMGPGPGEGSLAPAPGCRGGLFGATLAAAAAAETAAVTEEEAESLAMAAVDRMTTAPEAPRGTVKLVRGTRNMAARERRKGDETLHSKTPSLCPRPSARRR